MKNGKIDMEIKENLCPIKATQRQRVIGNNGPRRHELVCFNKLDDVPVEVVDQIFEITNIYSENDLGGDQYQISQHCDLENAFQATGGYRQILLQKCKELEVDVINETNYNVWNDSLPYDKIKKYLEETFGTVCRTRISVMPPGHELGWHIDTDTSVLCRIQICARGAGTRFQYNVKNHINEFTMKQGEMYFVNVGWTHRVINAGKESRIVLIAGVNFSDIQENEKLKNA